MQRNSQFSPHDNASIVKTSLGNSQKELAKPEADEGILVGSEEQSLVFRPLCDLTDDDSAARLFHERDLMRFISAYYERMSPRLR